MRARILPCDWLIAFAQICGILRSTRFAVMSTLASIDEPTATTAIGEVLRADLPQRVDVAAVGLHGVGDALRPLLHEVGVCRRPRALRGRAWRAGLRAPAPKRPSPMTSTGASWGMRSTNDGPLFWQAEQLAALARGQGRGKVTVPTRPAHMVAARMYLPASGRLSVTPVTEPARCRTPRSRRTAHGRAAPW